MESSSNQESESQNNYYNINFFSESTEPSSDDNSFTQKSSIGKVDIDKFLINIHTQKGSITYQYLINQYSHEELNALFIQLTPFLISIMCSEYGNYFFQRLVLKLNVYQRLIIFHQIKNNFIQISANSSGTYSIQALISAISTEKEDKILRELIQHNLLLMFTNENAHHVIQKIIIELSEERRKYINDCIFEKIDKICVNEYGYLCVIKFINNNSSLLYRVELIQAINKHFDDLLSNKFGCNVILYMMEKYGNGYSGFIFSEIKQNLISFSISNKVSIPLVIKVLNYMNKYYRYNFINLIWEIFKEDQVLECLINHQKGIDIILTLVKYSTKEQKQYFKLKSHSLFRNKIGDNKLFLLLI